MIPKITKKNIKEIEAHLKKTAPELSSLINKNGICTLYKREYNHFHYLVKSIISQQLSNKAAKTIFLRLVAKLGKEEMFPENLAVSKIIDLREVGISIAKSNFIINLANEVISGNLDFNKISILSDDNAVKKLIEFKGIGQWTAEMFLIFSLGRADVISVNDVGIIRGTQKIYELKTRPTEKTLLKISDSWRPFRSVACWHLWRSID
jgi:DNA-3-methyladenine glycosylase II